MVKKILKYFLILFFSTIIAFFVYLTFNSEFRRNFLTYSIAGYKYYQKILIKSSLPDVKKASDQLIKFVKVSDYLSSYGKNSFLVSVYQNAKIIEEKISSEKDYLYFSEVVCGRYLFFLILPMHRILDDVGQKLTCAFVEKYFKMVSLRGKKQNKTSNREKYLNGQA